MARQSLEAQLAALDEPRHHPDAAAVEKALRQALAGKTGFVAAKAARLAAERGLAELAPAMEAAFERFLEDPVRRDPGCKAKAALAAALYELNAPATDVFLRGAHHVQLEPVWGGQEDTAAELRSTCAMALAYGNEPGVMVELAQLLADPQRSVRAAAARALAAGGRPEALPLIYLKLLTASRYPNPITRQMEEEDPEVICECGKAALALDPPRGLALMNRFLDDPEEAVARAAAMALGESRVEQALPLLEEHLERTLDRERRRTLFLAIGLLRLDRAQERLLDTVREGPLRDARDALAALALYRHDEALKARTMEAVAQRPADDLTSTAAERLWEQGEAE